MIKLIIKAVDTKRKLKIEVNINIFFACIFITFKSIENYEYLNLIENDKIKFAFVSN